MTEKRLVVWTLAGLGICLVAILPAFIRATSTKARNPCVNSLRVIAGAKEQWATENHKTTNDSPSWDDLRPYFRFNRRPNCPEGGVYILGRVGESPRCSRGGTHTLPEP